MRVQATLGISVFSLVCAFPVKSAWWHTQHRSRPLGGLRAARSCRHVLNADSSVPPVACSSLGQSHSLAKCASGVGRVNSSWLLVAGRKLCSPFPDLSPSSKPETSAILGRKMWLSECATFLFFQMQQWRGAHQAGWGRAGNLQMLGMCACVCVAKISSEGS